MNPKKMLIGGTMALTIAMSGSGIWSSEAKASSPHAGGAKQPALTAVRDDELAQMLGASDDDIYYALLEGRSLAELAATRYVDPQAVIDLQVSEMLAQLESRLAEGSITERQFEAQKSELPGIIAKSVMGTA